MLLCTGEAEFRFGLPNLPYFFRPNIMRVKIEGEGLRATPWSINISEPKHIFSWNYLNYIPVQDVELEQPIFGANYIKGKVRAQPGGNFTGKLSWITFLICAHFDVNSYVFPENNLL